MLLHSRSITFAPDLLHPLKCFPNAYCLFTPFSERFRFPRWLTPHANGIKTETDLTLLMSHAHYLVTIPVEYSLPGSWDIKGSLQLSKSVTLELSSQPATKVIPVFWTKLTRNFCLLPSVKCLCPELRTFLQHTWRSDYVYMPMTTLNEWPLFIKTTSSA